MIDEKVPRAKRAEGEVKITKTVLPPISRLREADRAPQAPAAPTPKVAPKPEPAPAAEVPVPTPIAEPEGDPQKIIHIKPPIIVKELATQLGLKTHLLIKELMDFVKEELDKI